MNLKRLAASAVAGVTAVAGLSVVTASPAAAAAGVWRSYQTSPTTVGTAAWHCGRTLEIETSVYAQACAIRSTKTKIDVQVAVIVQNRRSSLYAAEAAVEMRNDRLDPIGRWECSRSWVGAKSWSVCFGQTRIEADTVSVKDAGVNGTFLPTGSTQA